jgi:hypothetical protein
MCLLINSGYKDKHIGAGLLREPVRAVATVALLNVYLHFYIAPGLQAILTVPS